MNLRALLLSLFIMPLFMAFGEPPSGKGPQDTKENKANRDEKPSKAEEKSEDKSKEKPKLSETSHSLTLGGVKFDYTATAGTLPIKDAEGKITADIFFIAYTRLKEGT